MIVYVINTRSNKHVQLLMKYLHEEYFMTY